MLFELGQCVQTSGIVNESMNYPVFALAVLNSFDRHKRGDWGDLCDEDKALNNAALKEEGRILSAYDLPTREGNEKVYIITEWDRSVTTILFASEY
jgi:hypothetical protein